MRIDSTSIIMTSSESTVDLLDKCLSYMEDLYLRSFHGEPWCFVTMGAAIMLLRIHLGHETLQTGKASCAQSFLNLHYKHTGRQETHLLGIESPPPPGLVDQIDVSVSLMPSRCCTRGLTMITR
jgi:hypothetical protein